jgi:hypothetical protein
LSKASRDPNVPRPPPYERENAQEDAPADPRKMGAMRFTSRACASAFGPLLVVAALAACGGGKKPATTATTPAKTAEPKKEEPPAKPPEKPADPPPDACADADACSTLGLKLAKKGETDGAKIALGKACSGAVRGIDACAALTVIMLKEKEKDAGKLAETAKHGCNPVGADEGEREARAMACFVWGSASRDGKGATADDKEALRAFETGCRLREEMACDARREILAAQAKKQDEESGVPGANLNVASITTNGVTVEKIACKSEGGLGGMFGSLALGKPFADKKKALDGCVKGGSKKVRVRWNAVSGKMKDVKVISAPDASNACIEKALTGAVATVPGTCAASVDVGKK